MSEQPDFGAFTPAERRAALVLIAGQMIASGHVPKFFPADKHGNAKAVEPKQIKFAIAVHAKRYVDNLEYVIRPQDPQTSSSAAPAQWGGNDTPL